MCPEVAPELGWPGKLGRACCKGTEGGEGDVSDLRTDVIAIGDLARNRYWGEKAPRREEYATSTLVRAGEMVLLVDPGWPAEVMRTALFYRTGLEPEAVTHVFLTHFDPAHRHGLGVAPDAVWWMYEEEIRYADAELPHDAPDRTILARLEAAPEKLAPGVDLFPTFGHTPGHTSLLVYTALESTVIAGDAVLTREHLEHSDLGEPPWELEKAKESFAEVLEVADVIVPGHDNVFGVRTGGPVL
jgi:glyoxylase-like metal-dependent hydrolase (beta-lactamase superfamily II)